MKKITWMSLAMSCAVVVGAGCATSREGPYVPVAKPKSAEAAGEPVVLLHRDLVGKIAVDRAPIMERNANGLLEIQIALRNRTNVERLRIQVQTLFFDQAGRVLGSEPGSAAAWDTLIFSPNQTMYYTQRSLTPEAEYYVVRVRYLKKTR